MAAFISIHTYRECDIRAACRRTSRRIDTFFLRHVSSHFLSQIGTQTHNESDTTNAGATSFSLLSIIDGNATDYRSFFPYYLVLLEGSWYTQQQLAAPSNNRLTGSSMENFAPANYLGPTPPLPPLHFP
mmetsp:Transcript_10613/g.25552  ORF Transcript_10613/g.25552 Transcript_10613/m.25552 type:complete len:129 (-) Transcript_10613:658-1044(-)